MRSPGKERAFLYNVYSLQSRTHVKCFLRIMILVPPISSCFVFLTWFVEEYSRLNIYGEPRIKNHPRFFSNQYKAGGVAADVYCSGELFCNASATPQLSSIRTNNPIHKPLTQLYPFHNKNSNSKPNPHSPKKKCKAKNITDQKVPNKISSSQ